MAVRHTAQGGGTGNAPSGHLPHLRSGAALKRKGAPLPRQSCGCAERTPRKGPAWPGLALRQEEAVGASARAASVLRLTSRLPRRGDSEKQSNIITEPHYVPPDQKAGA